MRPNSTTVGQILPELNRNYFLPSFQREFRWNEERVTLLFDSLMMGMPLGVLLFWEVAPRNRREWQAYRFEQHFRAGAIHAERGPAGGAKPLRFVVDGQQRLTALNIGLRGSLTTKVKYKRASDPYSWVRRRLFVDLLEGLILDDPDSETEDHALRKPYYDFRFLAPSQEAPRWFLVSTVLSIADEPDLRRVTSQTLSRLPNLSAAKRSRARATIRRLYEATCIKTYLSYMVEDAQDYDRVLEIFIRSNEGGLPLSKPDLMMSLVSANWGEDARELITDLVHGVNQGAKNAVDKRFILKCSLMLSDLPIEYRVANFKRSNVALVRANWQKIRTAIVEAIQLVNHFGLDANTLPGINALLPIIYFVYHHPHLKYFGSGAVDVANTRGIRRWLTWALLNNTFSGNSDTMLRETRRVLQSDHTPTFPIDALDLAARSKGRRSGFSRQAADDFMDVTYSRRTSFLALSLLYDDNNWGTLPYDQDHIFPRSLLTWNRLQELGVAANDMSKFSNVENRIGNLQLLTATENSEKNAQPFEDWLNSRDEAFRTRHLIPSNRDLCRIQSLPKFVVARQRLIGKRLVEVFGPAAT
jgi:hypothetical protein